MRSYKTDRGGIALLARKECLNLKDALIEIGPCAITAAQLVE